MSTRVVLLCGLVLHGCAAERSEAPQQPQANEAQADEPHASEPASQANAPVAGSPADLVATVAREYKTWRLADDEFHWAPGLCRLPVGGGDHISRAAGAPHDSKLFRLWTLDIAAYGVAAGWTNRVDPGDSGLRGTPMPGVTQVLVKESFEAVPLEPGEVPRRVGTGTHSAVRDGKTFRPGDPIGLFVMLQLATPRADTDEGWIYGTVAPDGTVSSASDSGGCRDCHAARPNRVFGIPRPPAFGM